MNWLRQSYISRGLVIFFFFFTVADLANPHLCAEEMGLAAFPFTITESHGADQSITISPKVPADSRQEKSQAPAHSEEDCFCCCSHILPSQSFVVQSILPESSDTDPIVSTLPTGLPSQHYRPPRLS